MSTARTPPPPQERPEETLSVTPPHPRRSRSGRRRQALPPPAFPPAEATTQPVRAFNPDDDEDSLALGDDDAHENTQGGLRPPRREGRGGMWMAVAGVLLLLVGLGTVAVMMGLDGGRVSARVGPALSRLGVGPKSGTPVPVNTASPTTGTAANAPVAPGPATTVPAGSSAVDSKSATLTDTARTAEEPTDGAAPSTPEPPEDTRVALAQPPASDDAPEEKAKGPTDSEASADTQAAAEDSPSTRKPRAVAKRSLHKKSRAPEEAPAGSTAEGGSESALAAEPGFLTLVTEPHAKVFLGGRELGDTPLFKVKLPAGKHSLKLVDGEGKALKLPVDIKPGEITSVRIPLAMLSGK
ncbi:PEGA domain-containing protein [Pyxidicoccus sp. 3LG]